VQQPKSIVLVVEDEPLMRMHAVSFVLDAGFDTVEASNADDAIAILEGRKDIRIVFTDINMPGSMARLAHAIRRRWPPIELILTSGDFQVAEDELPLHPLAIRFGFGGCSFRASATFSTSRARGLQQHAPSNGARAA
jgi:CheY-like chemotaxis protein